MTNLSDLRAKLRELGNSCAQDWDVWDYHTHPKNITKLLDLLDLYEGLLGDAKLALSVSMRCWPAPNHLRAAYMGAEEAVNWNGCRAVQEKLEALSGGSK